MQRRKRRVEHREPVLDGGADFRRASDPFADRAGEHGRGQAKAPRPSTTMTRLVIHGEMPCRLAALTSGASVKATIEAAMIGNRMARPI